jgi:disulfide bond formation protein DsbB
MVPVETLNTLSAMFTVFGQVVFAALVLGLLLDRFWERPEYLGFFARNAFEIAFGFSLVASFGSLYYSDVIGFEPCFLCWWQRIFMYPTAIILGMGIFRRDHRAADYAMVLSAIGAAIALYHYSLEWGVVSAAPCPVGGVDCAARLVFEFGYISIPLMSLTVFLTIFAVLFARKRLHRESLA